jgi:hypothetical protein
MLKAKELLQQHAPQGLWKQWQAASTYVLAVSYQPDNKALGQGRLIQRTHPPFLVFSLQNKFPNHKPTTYLLLLPECFHSNV